MPNALRARDKIASLSTSISPVYIAQKAFACSSRVALIAAHRTLSPPPPALQYGWKNPNKTGLCPDWYIDFNSILRFRDDVVRRLRRVLTRALEHNHARVVRRPTRATDRTAIFIADGSRDWGSRPSSRRTTKNHEQPLLELGTNVCNGLQVDILKCAFSVCYFYLYTKYLVPTYL